MKKTGVILAGLAVSIGCFAMDLSGTPESSAPPSGRGERFESDGLRLYPVPAEFPLAMPEAALTVRVDGHALGLYVDRNFWQGLVHFASFDFDPAQPVTVEIELPEMVKTFRLLPEKYGLRPERQGRTVSFTVAEPDSMITLVTDENYRTAPVLHLFANAIDPDAPSGSTPNVRYFGPGYHDLQAETGSDELVVSGSETVYLASGAVVDGKIALAHADGAAVRGHGMLMRNRYEGMLLTTGFSRNITYDGFLLYNSRPQCWTAGTHEADGVEVSNVKVIAPHYASTDGFDLVNSRNLHFVNTFVRASDDAVVIKGLADGLPADCPPNENMLFEQMQLWNDCNNAFNMGAEARAAAYRNITLKDSDILFSYDDPHHHGKLDERSAMSISVVHGTFFENIRFENIRVNRCERLICLTFLESFWFGSLPGEQETPGGMRDITFRQISSPNRSESPIANQILLHGWPGTGDTPVKRIENLRFEDVTIQGKPLTADSEHFRIDTPELVDFEVVGAE